MRTNKLQLLISLLKNYTCSNFALNAQMASFEQISKSWNGAPVRKSRKYPTSVKTAGRPEPQGVPHESTPASAYVRPSESRHASGPPSSPGHASAPACMSPLPDRTTKIYILFQSVLDAAFVNILLQ